MTTTILCEICGDPIDPTLRSTHLRVEGWLPRNMAGGGQIRNRRQIPGRFAHEVCVRSEALGIPIDQGSLL